jgi:hypothetical protein
MTSNAFLDPVIPFDRGTERKKMHDWEIETSAGTKDANFFAINHRALCRWQNIQVRSLRSVSAETDNEKKTSNV